MYGLSAHHVRPFLRYILLLSKPMTIYYRPYTADDTLRALNALFSFVDRWRN